MSHVRKVDASKAFALTGLPPNPGKAIGMPGSGKAYGMVGVPIGIEGGPVGFLSWHLSEWPTRCK